MPDHPGFSWANTSAVDRATSMPVLGSLLETLKDFPLVSRRDVFVFGGTMAEFKAALEVSGADVRPYAPDKSLPPMASMFPPPGSLSCYEVDGKVWVAAHHRDVDDAMAGKLPFKRIGGK